VPESDSRREYVAKWNSVGSVDAPTLRFNRLEVLDGFNRLNIEFVSFSESIDTFDPLGQPSWSSSVRSPSSNAT
jgi:hypothetical protein